MSTQVIIVLILTFVINLITTRSYSLRIMGISETKDLKRWLKKSKEIPCGYKNIEKMERTIERLK